MMRGQVMPAFMAALLGEGVSSAQIEAAVARTLELPLGRPLSGLAWRDARSSEALARASLVRAFVFEQARLLERAA